jgi:hypothetical protein
LWLRYDVSQAPQRTQEFGLEISPGDIRGLQNLSERPVVSKVGLIDPNAGFGFRGLNRSSMVSASPQRSMTSAASLAGIPIRTPFFSATELQAEMMPS